MAITTSITVSFSDPKTASEQNAILRAEFDSRPAEEGGLNDGKTSFEVGDSPVYLVFMENITDISQQASAGAIGPAGSGIKRVGEWITFSDSDEARLGYPPAGALDVYWLGNSLGSLAYAGGGKVKAASKGVATAFVVYDAAYDAYRLSNVDFSAFPPIDGFEDAGYQVTIHIVGEVG